jgi:hypothetical protein
MDTTALSYLLVFLLIVILNIYLYQNMVQNGDNKPNTNNSKIRNNFMMPIINDTCNIRTSGMPVHRVGPVYNFHQSFSKCNKLAMSGCPTESEACQYALLNGSPTGIPELGWRNYYLKNFNDNTEVNIKLNNEDPFTGTPIRNFLDNLTNVDNIYRKCY